MANNQLITTGSFPKALKQGVFAFTQLMYDQYDPIYPNMFETKPSNMAYEELVSGDTFGLAFAKPQGSAIVYQGEKQNYVTRATHVTYATGYVMTIEEYYYNLYDKLSKQRGTRLADCFTRTKELVGANIFNNGFNSSFTYGDGVALFSTAHPTTAGNQQNTPTVATDFSETALEDMIILQMTAVDNVGNKIKLMPKRLGGSPFNAFEFTRVLKSDKQNDTANNATNAVKTLGMVPESFVNTYFTDPDAWFLFSDINAEDGLTHFESIPFKVGVENDSDTLNEKHYGYEAYSFTTGDFRAVYGSPGA